MQGVTKWWLLWLIRFCITEGRLSFGFGSNHFKSILPTEQTVCFLMHNEYFMSCQQVLGMLCQCSPGLDLQFSYFRNFPFLSKILPKSCCFIYTSHSGISLKCHYAMHSSEAPTLAVKKILTLPFSVVLNTILSCSGCIITSHCVKSEQRWSIGSPEVHAYQ